MTPRTLSLPVLLGLTTTLAAQAPDYRVTPAVQPGGQVSTVLLGLPNQPFASLIDAGGGPRSILGETLFLDLGPALTLLDAGLLDSGGLRTLGFTAPPGIPLGAPVYLQAVVVDAGAPNGVFRASDGESTVLYGSSLVMVEDIVDPVAQGFTGDFDKSRTGRLQAAPVRRRVQSVVPRLGVPFGQPILGPLNPNGVRIQMVYRAVDIGATGIDEELVAIRWRPFQGRVTDDRFQRLAIDVVHSRVVPDYTIDPFSALPRFPNSGLDLTFANNVKPGDTPVRVYDGPYAIRAADLRPDGYMSYPDPTQRFVYNGFDSLLIDLRMAPSPGANGTNGQQVHIMVLSSPQPNSRARDSGEPGRPVDPFLSTQARTGDNSLHEVQLEFARSTSEAISPWRQAPAANPDYHAPYVAASFTRAVTSVQVEYRGARDATGRNATFWSPIIDVADGFPYLQYRVRMRADPRTGEVPSVDMIVIPVN